MAVPSYIAAAALGSSTGSVGPTTGIDTTGATALRVVVITQQSGTPTVTDSRTNTWTTDRAAVLLNGTFTAYAHFFKATTNNVGTSHTFSATGTTAASIWAIAVGPSAGGSLTLTAFDAIADATSPYTSNSITPASADALLIAFGASDGAGSPVTTTWQNGETGRADVTDHNNFWGGSIATRSVTSSGSYAASFTDNSTSPANSVVAILAVTESGGSSSGPVGLASESDFALALSPGSNPVGAAVENDTALPLNGINFAQDGDLFLFGDDSGNESSMGGVRLFGGFIASGSSGATGLASETDTALARTAVQLRAVGLAAQTDAALALAGLQLRATGLAAETDTAFARAAVQVRAVGLATETDAALALPAAAGNQVGAAAETDAALALAGVQLRVAGLCTEVDASLALAATQIRATGLATETDTALARSAVHIQAAGIAIENDTSLALSVGGAVAVGLATETDTAFALAGVSTPQIVIPQTSFAEFSGAVVKSKQELKQPRIKAPKQTKSALRAEVRRQPQVLQPVAIPVGLAVESCEAVALHGLVVQAGLLRTTPKKVVTRGSVEDRIAFLEREVSSLRRALASTRGN